MLPSCCIAVDGEMEHIIITEVILHFSISYFCHNIFVRDSVRDGAN